MGINTAAVYIGLALGPSIGGFLVESLGWRSVFYVNVPIGMGVIALALLKIPADAVEKRGEKLDPIDMVAWGLGLSMVLLDLTPSETHGSPFSRTLMVAGFAVLALFIFFETRVVSPLLDVKLFRNAPFAFSTLTALLNYSSVFGVSFIMSLYLQFIPGFGAEQAGFILLAQPVMMAALSPVGGWLSDRVETRIVASIGMALVSTVIYSLSRLGAASEWWEIAARLMLLGTGHAFFSSPNVNATVISVTKRQYGVAAAILSTMRFTGQAISIAIATSVLSAQLGRVVMSAHAGAQVPVEPFMKGMKIALEILCGICALGVVTSLVRGTVRNAAKVQTESLNPPS